MSEETVGARTFDVPDKYRVSHDVAFLPASQNDGLTFVLNPEVERGRQVLVGVDAVADVCNRVGKPVEALQQQVGDLLQSWSREAG
ncbi:MAG: hypothetical protein EOO77_41265 [Oxalobacteraceae bacterium]|nr:MAG: hypothetical protein EOO77_41265 [Oxalobacteraceae bacterium]